MLILQSNSSAPFHDVNGQKNTAGRSRSVAVPAASCTKNGMKKDTPFRYVPIQSFAIEAWLQKRIQIETVFTKGYQAA
jgi:hypothetical protein